jgi:chitin-binding protein
MRTGRLASAILAGTAPMLVTALAWGPAAPAAAHGAPDYPLSRTAACAPDGPQVQSAACQAALAAGGVAAFGDWDYIRVAGVAGRDREVIPDGALCSGGLDQFQGLDLPRADWPVTEVRAGAELTFTYRTTIPHKGVFRLYLTRDGYDPDQPLAWSDVEDEPFLTVENPELVDDAYQLPGRLPAGKTDRHLILTIWQNTDTPDTYYSCSDVVFDAPAPASPAVTDDVGEPDRAEPLVLEPAARPEPSDGTPVLLALVGALAVALAAAVMIALSLRRRADARGGSHRHRRRPR